MKRFCFLAALMLLSPSAYAGGSISFSVGDHRVHVEASRYCRSTSCASVSVSGLYDSHRKRDRFEDDDRDQGAPVKAVPTVAPPASNPPAPTIVTAPPPAVYKPAAVATQTVAVPPPPAPVQQIAIPLPPPPPVARPAETARPAPEIARVSHEVEDDFSDTPVGDWQTEGNGAVRIAKCGNALCGYVLNSSSNDKGEAVLINMKAKTDTQWTGSVYSHDSGDTFYGTVNMKGINTLRVEACALGRFYCSGNNWSRITTDRAESLMSSRQLSGAPRS